MTDNLKEVVRNIHRALNDRNTEKAISFFDENAVIVQPEGTFKGSNEIKRYVNWLFDIWPKLEFSETSLIIEGDKVAHEYLTIGTSQKGIKGQSLCSSIYKFKGNKVEELHTIYDRLAIASRQSEGMSRISRKAVKSIVEQTEKGLK